MSKDLSYKIPWNASMGSNNKAEALAVWGILWLTSFLNIPDIHIYGDSNIIMYHVNGKAHIKQSTLLGWLREIENLWT